ncbi:MAG TPA: endonuclease/exonuclease/phosphatase family protein [Flavisolibacter sp.]|nr:endonuclease/exonuclease/phosphatase family protein [Flavisolibacter sp.]
MATYRRITKTIFVVLNVLTAVAFLLASLAPSLNPQKWWFVSMLGLGYAFTIITLITFIFFWLIFRPKLMLISLLALAIGWKGIAVFFAFHNPDRFEYEKKPNALRVVHWNVGRFTEWKRNNNKGSRTRLKMMDLIKEQNADVLCLQEFFHSKDTVYYDNLNYIMKELGYPYYYYSWDNDGHLQWVGNIIFSRLPIVDSGLIRYPRPSIPESLLYADVKVQNDTIRFYTTHLQSVQFKKKDFETVERIKKTDEEAVKQSRTILGKLKRGIVYRKIQADVVRQVTRQSPHPYIITGDFNDVPNSYTYFTIRGDELKDAFLETGFGVGRTYTDISPTLRIDYMLATKEIQLYQFNRVSKVLNDHHMLVADVAVRSKK